MLTDVITSATSSDQRSSSSTPPLQMLNALSIHIADAMTQINGLFQAYQCIEKMAMPRSTEAVDLGLSDREIYALLAALNEPMKRHIHGAQVACDQLMTSIQQEQAE